MDFMRAYAPATICMGRPERPDQKAPARLVDRVLGAVPPPALVLLSIFSIQIGAAIATHLFSVFGPAGTVFWRIAFAAVILFVIFRPRLAGISRPGLALIALLGFVIATTNLCFYEAIARIPLGIAVTVEFLGPLGIAVATSRRPRDLLWTALAGAGLWMMMPEVGARLDIVGVAFAAFAGLGWSGFILTSRHVARRVDGNAGLALAMVLAAVLALPFGASGLADFYPDWSALSAAFAVAVLSTAIPLSLEYAALRRLPPRTYAILVTLEPAVAAIVGALLLDQGMPPRVIAAVAAVTAAAMGVVALGQAPRER
jgi:inner membrane transporter RhtA